VQPAVILQLEFASMTSKGSLSSFQAYALVAFGAFCVSFAAPMVKWIPLDPTLIGFYRTALATLILGLLSFQFRPRKWRAKSPQRDWWKPLMWAAIGGASFGADLYVWHKSILAVGAGLATLLANTHIFWVAVFSALWLKERLTWKFVIWVAVALGGVSLLMLPSETPREIYFVGIQLGLLTGVFYAGYYVCLRESQRALNPLSLIPNLAVASFFMALVLFVMALVEGTEWVWPSWSVWGWLVILGVGVHACGWLAISKGMPHVAAGPGSFILLLQTVAATAWGVIWFDESLELRQWIGAGLTLVAVYGVTMNRNRE
jgi:drug/metabolite transporter (DMT)-like permease